MLCGDGARLIDGNWSISYEGSCTRKSETSGGGFSEGYLYAHVYEDPTDMEVRHGLDEWTYSSSLTLLFRTCSSDMCFQPDISGWRRSVDIEGTPFRV